MNVLSSWEKRTSSSSFASTSENQRKASSLQLLQSSMIEIRSGSSRVLQIFTMYPVQKSSLTSPWKAAPLRRAQEIREVASLPTLAESECVAWQNLYLEKDWDTLETRRTKWADRTLKSSPRGNLSAAVVRVHITRSNQASDAHDRYLPLDRKGHKTPGNMLWKTPEWDESEIVRNHS